MAHDATKVLLGSTPSSDKVVTCETGDPADFLAGTAVRRASDGSLLVASNGTAALIGVSMGPSLSDTEKTAVCRAGNDVPLLVTPTQASLTEGDLTFTAKTTAYLGAAGNGAITIAMTDTETAGSEEVTVTGTDIVIGIEDGVSTATQIIAAIEASEEASALISVSTSSGATPQSIFSESALADGDDVANEGVAVQLSTTTGKAVESGAATGAVYRSGLLTGVYPDGTTAPCALVALPGGF